MKKVFLLLLICLFCKVSNSQNNLILFYLDKYELTDSAKNILDEIALKNKELNKKIIIKGYTDSSGSVDYNKNLSLNRSVEAKTYLVSKGINKNNIAIQYYGENDSENPNFLNNPKQRFNRCVKIFTEEDKVVDNNSNEKTKQNNDKDSLMNDSIDKVNFSEIYKSLDVAEQKFEIDNRFDTTIIGNEGTTINLPANSFLTRFDEPAKGKIIITIREYYKLEDMLLSELTTTTPNGQILQSGGMFHITATCDGREVRINTSKPLNVSFPKITQKEQMQIFNGQHSGNNIVWGNARNGFPTYKQISRIKNYNKYFFVFGKKRLTEQKIGKEIARKIKYPVAGYEKMEKGIVNVSFQIDGDGVINNINIENLKPSEKKLNNNLKNTVVDYLTNRSALKVPPIKNKKRAIKVIYTVHIAFGLIPIRVNNNADNMTTTVFPLSDLGWINCDRFSSYSNFIAVKVNEKYNENISFKLIVPEIKAIMPSNMVENKYYFSNIPKDLDLKLVGIKVNKKKLYYSIVTTKASEKPVTDIKYTEVDPKDLKSILAKNL